MKPIWRVVLAAIAVALFIAAVRSTRDPGPLVIATLVCVALALFAQRRWQRAQRSRALEAIRSQVFPTALREQLQLSYPHLSGADTLNVERGLRQFFGAQAQARGAFVAMPSKVVDVAWHAFIAQPSAYAAFCQRAFGQLLAHAPPITLEGVRAPVSSRRAARVVKSADDRAEGLRLAWRYACADEGINQKHPLRLPLLFALDTWLAIPGGYRYVPDCRVLSNDRGDSHCGAELGSGSSADTAGGDDGHGGGDGWGDGGGDAGGGGGGGDGGGGD
jgi:hypothetical protein